MIDLIPIKLEWINGEVDDPKDHCAHSQVLFQVNETVFVAPTDGKWTVSATALYLLRTLENDSVPESSVNQGAQLFPCCAFNGVAEARDYKVVFFGCPNGVDVWFEHQDGNVEIRSNSGCEVVAYDSWKEVVEKFVDLILEFYRKCSDKSEINDVVDREMWEAYWSEIKLRRLRIA